MTIRTWTNADMEKMGDDINTFIAEQSIELHGLAMIREMTVAEAKTLISKLALAVTALESLEGGDPASAEHEMLLAHDAKYIERELTKKGVL